MASVPLVFLVCAYFAYCVTAQAGVGQQQQQQPASPSNQQQNLVPLLGGGQQQVSVCPTQSQQTVRQCAQELRTLGVFNQNQGEIDALTWEQIRRRSRQYFTQICDAYRRFDQCVSPYKLQCWYQEPIKAEFAVASEALEYVCGEGYYGMLSSWDCFLQASTRSDVINCEARIMAAARTLADSRGSVGYANLKDDGSCRILQDYMSCIKQPIFNQCGKDAWQHVKEAVQRPTHVYLPYCTLAGTASLPSIVVTISSIVLAILFWKI